jgi:AbrB family looped-hinge helix DNA binding protein
MRSCLSSKGQITVPIEVREKLGLHAGTVVHFEVVEGGALLRKGERDKHPVDDAYGILKLDGSVDSLVDEMRGPQPAKRGARRR